MPYAISDEKGEFAKSSSFMFYMPFTVTGRGTIRLEDEQTGCFLAVLSDGLPRNQIPNIPNWRDGATASEKVTMASDEESVGTLVFNHMALENQVEIERENEWSELRIYGGRRPIGTIPADWIVTNDWRMEPRGQNEGADNFSKYFDFGSIKDALCDETVVVRSSGGSLQRITLCRRMIKDTIAEMIIQNSNLLDVTEGMPALTLRTSGNSKHVTNVADREFFNQIHNAQTEHSGYVLIAAGAFAFQSADTMLEEWRMPDDGGLDFNLIRQKLGAIAFAPNNVPADGNRLFRQLRNIDDTYRDGVTTGRGMPDAPIEVLFVERVQ